PGELAVAIVSDERNRPAAGVVLLGLRCSWLRRFVLGRSQASDERILAYLRARRVPLLYGKATYLSKLAELDAAHGGPTIKPRALFCSGANLFADERVALERHFGCTITNAYTSAEGGLIALECPASGELHVQAPGIQLEVI